MSDPKPPMQDLGFGSVVARESRQRLLNRDGTFNVRRTGLGFLESWSAYHYLIGVSWPRFLLLVAAAYAGANALFGLAFFACGPDAIAGPGDTVHAGMRYARSYFFSVQTLATIGYGHLSPVGLLPNLLVALESVVGLLGLALMTGLAFARFARPVAAIRFSDVAVVGPYRGASGFMFRVANVHQNQLVDVEARVMLSRKPEGGESDREFVELPLERQKVAFFPLSWTVVHPIDSGSPLQGATDGSLRASEAEFLIMLTAFHETFSSTVHTRTSYRAEEVVFGARFKSILEQREDGGILYVDVRGLSEIERVEETGATELPTVQERA